jgi:hypothetical protein
MTVLGKIQRPPIKSGNFYNLYDITPLSYYIS